MPNLIVADQPIVNADEDRYGFRDMAELIAHEIVAMEGPQGTIIGIDGDWGSGKTSFVNLVQRAVTEQIRTQSTDDRTLLVLDSISAWKKVGLAEEVLLACDRLARTKANTGLSVVATVKRGTGAMRAAVRWVRRGAEAVDAAAFKGKLADVSDLLKLASHGMGAIVDVVDGEADRAHENALADAAVHVEMLRTEGRLRILLTIDDIDRLLADEMVRLFSQLREVVDHAGVVVILPIAVRSAAKLLDGPTGGQGEAYLGKVLTNLYSVPEISRDARVGLLRTMVAEWLRHDEEIPWMDWKPSDFEHFERWFVENFLLTPRDFTRLGTAVRLRMRLQRGTIFVLDVVAIELARLFDRQAFTRLESFHKLLVQGINTDNLTNPSPSSISTYVVTVLAFENRCWRELVAEVWIGRTQKYWDGYSANLFSSKETKVLFNETYYRGGRFLSFDRRSQFFAGNKAASWLRNREDSETDVGTPQKFCEQLGKRLALADERVQLLEVYGHFARLEKIKPSWYSDSPDVVFECGYGNHLGALATQYHELRALEAPFPSLAVDTSSVFIAARIARTADDDATRNAEWASGLPDPWYIRLLYRIRSNFAARAGDNSEWSVADRWLRPDTVFGGLLLTRAYEKGALASSHERKLQLLWLTIIPRARQLFEQLPDEALRDIVRAMVSQALDGIYQTGKAVLGVAVVGRLLAIVEAERAAAAVSMPASFWTALSKELEQMCEGVGDGNVQEPGNADA